VPYLPQTAVTGTWQRVGFVLLCLFALCGYANEFSLRALHTKAYLSTALWVLLPLVLIASGNILRPFRDRIGKLWLLFILWFSFAVPFSIWLGGSVNLWKAYAPRDWIQFLYPAAFIVSIPHFRRYMKFLIAADALLLVDSYWFGSAANGRLEIPDSIFFANANDLSLQLLIAVSQFAYLLFARRIWIRLVGGGAILLAMNQVFRTAGRGALLAVVALAIGSLLVLKRRMAFILVAGPMAMVVLLFAPASSLSRMTTFTQVTQAETVGSFERSALDSEQQRMDLLGQSIDYALQNPVVGVGPGQFPVAVSGDAVREGKQANWLGTHNSYTQVASECGIPAFVLYVSVIVLALATNVRMYRRADAVSERGRLAFCLFGSTLVYAVATFFFHVAYSAFLPSIAGMTVALKLAADAAEKA
jgi:O-antigen ligase